MDKSMAIAVRMPIGTTGQFFEYEPERNDTGLVSLTDLWKRFGSIENKEPKQWKRKAGKQFIENLCQTLKVPVGHLWKAGRGNGGGTWAHWQIAMTYMSYLSPEAQMAVNEIVKERIEEEADPELGVQRAMERHSKRLTALGRDDETINSRIKVILRRNTLTSTLQQHGVEKWGFAQVTDAEYLGWKGKTASELKEEMGVDKGNVRDFFEGYELDQLSFIESTLEEKIRRERLYGNGAQGRQRRCPACRGHDG